MGLNVRLFLYKIYFYKTDLIQNIRFTIEYYRSEEFEKTVMFSVLGHPQLGSYDDHEFV